MVRYLFYTIGDLTYQSPLVLKYIYGNCNTFCIAVKIIDVFKALFIYLHIYLVPPSLLPFPTFPFPLSSFLPLFLAHSCHPFIPPVLPYLFLTSLLPSLLLIGWFCYDILSNAKDPNNNSYNLFEVSSYSAWVYLPINTELSW